MKYKAKTLTPVLKTEAGPLSALLEEQSYFYKFVD